MMTSPNQAPGSGSSGGKKTWPQLPPRPFSPPVQSADLTWGRSFPTPGSGGWTWNHFRMPGGEGVVPGGRPDTANQRAAASRIRQGAGEAAEPSGQGGAGGETWM